MAKTLNLLFSAPGKLTQDFSLRTYSSKLIRFDTQIISMFELSHFSHFVDGVDVGTKKTQQLAAALRGRLRVQCPG